MQNFTSVIFFFQLKKKEKQEEKRLDIKKIHKTADKT
jgi:hypothetical protein